MDAEDYSYIMRVWYRRLGIFDTAEATLTWLLANVTKPGARKSQPANSNNAPVSATVQLLIEVCYSQH